jgi:methionyl aminopeptidase
VSKIGPNDPCWCSSGKKYKRCHQSRDLVKQLKGEAPVKARSHELSVKQGEISPIRTVPEHIVRPDYALTGRPSGSRVRNIIKNEDQIARMRRACRAARQVLEIAKSAVRPGVTTDAIDAITHQAYINLGGYPSTLNYHGYPKSLCTSVNEVICHGIPDSRVLQDGDILNLDVTIYLDGMHGDLSETVYVGKVDDASKKLVETTHACLMKGIESVRSGSRICDIGRGIQEIAEQHHYGVVRAFVGHGIGETFHMDPQVPHYFDPGQTFELRPGMVFTIEPMINQGDWRHLMWDDRWTAVTIDGKRSAQFEHTILVTERGVEILTLPEGEAQPFVF